MADELGHAKVRLMATLRRAQTTIHYEVHGSGPPLLLLAPGGMRSAIAYWARTPFDPIGELSSAYTVIAMDQRNAGRSRAPVSATDGWHSYAEDQLAVLDELGVERCHLLGGCIGAAFALRLIAEAATRVRAAVLLQPIGLSGSNREVFYELFDGWAAELAPERPDVSAAALPPFRSAMYDGDFVFSVSREQVSACATPLLVLRGNDVYHPSQVSEELVRLAPDAELIADWKTGSDVSRALARVREFLDEH